MQEITTAIDIQAEPETVWAILMDFDQYNTWNPFIRSIKGKPEVGTHLDALIGASGKKAMKISPVVQELDSPTRFSWLGSIGTKGVFDGHHQFEVIRTDTGVRFRHYEEFSGFLAPLILATIRKSTTRGFNEMNEALKTRAEAQT